MSRISDQLPAELKEAAIAARRAARPAWETAHFDRLARERQARQTTAEYHKLQRETRRAADSRQCVKCEEQKPLSAFEAHSNGNLRSTCRDCRAARKAELRAPAQALAKEQREAAKEAEREAAAREEELRRRKRVDRARGIRKQPLSPEKQQEAAERISYLTGLLLGTNPHQRIHTEQGWEMTTSELQKLWLHSGDKECASCEKIVPAAAMLPPGPANFYPNKCRDCAAAEYREQHLQHFGRPHRGAPRIPMLDGTSITVAELARRFRARQQSYRTANALPLEGASLPA